MQKSLDKKLARIAADPSCNEFILADAKDADMAFGISAPGMRRNPDGTPAGYRSLQEWREQIREIVRQELVDIMLLSASNAEVLAEERMFDDSPVTPAIRANDTTDIWLVGGQASYPREPSLPFRTAVLEDVVEPSGSRPFGLGRRSMNLGLYSITLNNDVSLDRATLQAYRDFRIEARQLDFQHFLEVFAPNALGERRLEDVPRFVNDSIVRLLAGINLASRPLFLKMPYFGPAALEQLVSYDSSLVVGILGGSSGTTFDAFNLLWEAKKYGARAALFGRKINHAEHQLSFIQQLRALADGQMEPAEAVRAYHGELAKLKIAPHRPLAEDLLATSPTKC